MPPMIAQNMPRSCRFTWLHVCGVAGIVGGSVALILGLFYNAYVDIAFGTNDAIVMRPRFDELGFFILAMGGIIVGSIMGFICCGLHVLMFGPRMCVENKHPDKAALDTQGTLDGGSGIQSV
jgi:hypothetical protein